MAKNGSWIATGNASCARGMRWKLQRTMGQSLHAMHVAHAVKRKMSISWSIYFQMMSKNGLSMVACSIRLARAIEKYIFCINTWIAQRGRKMDHLWQPTMSGFNKNQEENFTGGNVSTKKWQVVSCHFCKVQGANARVKKWQVIICHFFKGEMCRHAIGDGISYGEFDCSKDQSRVEATWNDQNITILPEINI